MNDMTPSDQRCCELIDDFWAWFDKCYGIYRDAHEAFPEYAESKRRLVRENQQYGDVREEDFLISFPRLQKVGENQQMHIHQADLPTVLKRNAHEGPNTKFLGRMMIVAIYSYWEDQTRPKLNQILGREVQIPIMGEVGALRRSIIHDHSKTVRLKKLELLHGFADGEFIEPTERHIGQIVDHVWRFCGEFRGDPKKFATGPAIEE